MDDERGCPVVEAVDGRPARPKDADHYGVRARGCGQRHAPRRTELARPARGEGLVVPEALVDLVPALIVDLDVYECLCVLTRGNLIAHLDRGTSDELVGADAG